MIFGLFEDWIKNGLLSLLKFIFDTLLSSSSSFWENGAVNALLTLVGTMSNAVFAFSVLRMLFSLAEDASTGSPIPWTTVFSGFAKSFVFANMIVLICHFMYDTSIKMIQLLPIGNLDTGMSWGKLGEIYVNSFPLLQGLEVFPFLLVIIFLIVGSVVYFVYSLLIFVHMLIHAISGILYIPDVVNGDTSAIGSWLRLGITFSLTFIIQSILFYMGMTFLVDMDLFGTDFILGIACIIGVFVVPKVLSKYGYSVGISGMFRSLGGIASSGISSFKK